ncbi:MAG: DUF2924 domain-containing protein [Chthoniobacteraceae bacterium]
MTTTEQHANIARQILEMEEMTLNQLREKWVEVWNEPCRSRNKNHLKKRIAWRMQALVFGGLSQRALDRARELADETFLKIKGTASETKAVRRSFRPSDDARLPIPGAVLTRVYNGRRIIVTVLDDGFEWDGQKYRSLSAVAKAVTGAHWNGFLFFGIERKGKEAAA